MNWLRTGALLSLIPSFVSQPILSSSVVVVSQPSGFTADIWDSVKIVEYTNNGFLPRQEIYLPSVNCSTCFTRNKCNSITQGSATLSWDGTTLLLVGENAPQGSNLSVGLNSSRVIAEINSNGALTSLTSFSGCMTNGQLNATCGNTQYTHAIGITGLGSSGWFVNCNSPGSAILFVNRSGSFLTVSTALTLTPGISITHAYNGNSSNPQVFVTGSSSTQRSLFQIGNSITAATLQGATANYISGTDVSQRSGSFTDTAYAVGLFIASPTQMFVCLANTILGGKGIRELTKWSATFGSWTTGRLFNMGQPCGSLTGRREGGILMLYATSCINFTGCNNSLYQINADAGIVTVVAIPPNGTVFSSVSIPPCDPTSTPNCPVSINGVWNIQMTPSATKSSLSSASPTATRMASQMNSYTSTNVGTKTSLNTVSWYGTISSIATGTSSSIASGTSSSIATGTSSSIATGTSSSIATGTSTHSISGYTTQTGTSSAQVTTTSTINTDSITQMATQMPTQNTIQPQPWTMYEVTVRVPSQSELQIQDPMSYLQIRTNYLCNLNTVAFVWIKRILPIGSSIQSYNLTKMSPVNTQSYTCQRGLSPRTRILQQLFDVDVILEVNISNQLVNTYPTIVSGGLSTYDQGLIAGIVCLFGVVFLTFFVKNLYRKQNTKSIFRTTPLHSLSKEQMASIETTEKPKHNDTTTLRNTFKPSKIRK